MPRKRVHHVVYEEKKKGAPWVLPALIAVLVAVVLFWPERERPLPGDALDMPPADLIGYWSTDDARYADRFLRISPSSVELGFGEEGGTMYGLIQSVNTWTEDGFEVVRLEYSTSEGDDALEITLHGMNRMRLRNPPEVVWTRS